jgi:hypothetical protein
MKVRAGDASLFAYPDVTVVCGEPIVHDDHGDVLVNPVVIFEVLSRSTSPQSTADSRSQRSTTASSSPPDRLRARLNSNDYSSPLSLTRM